MSNPINNNVFDTRDLIEYKEELQSDLIESYNSFIDDVDFEISEVSEINNEEFEEVNNLEIEELQSIESFCDELDSYAPDFQYGETVIHEDYFTEYCEELLKDTGYLPSDLPSWIVVDFDATADNMSDDYTAVDFEGSTYYIR